MAEAASATHETLLSLVDAEFESMEELRTYVLDTIVALGLSYTAQHSDRKRWYLRCRGKYEHDCPFQLNAVRRPRPNDDDKFVITKVVNHTCPQITHYNWKEGHKAKSIATRHAPNVEAYRQTKPAQIKSSELAIYGNAISYKQAWRAKSVILQSHEGSESGGFHRIWDLLIRASFCGSVPNDEETGHGMNCRTQLTLSNEALPMKHYVSSARNPDQVVPRFTFENYFASPAICQLAYRSMRRIIMLDGCHLKTQHKLILLVAVGLDGEGKTLPLAWSVVWAENKSNWVYFLKELYEALDHNEGNIDESVIITDRQKGLIPALAEVFPRTPHFFCIHHIGNNIQEEFGQGSRKLFMAAAYATTEAAFKAAIKKIKDDGAEGLAAYVDAIPPNKYARFAITHPRYGQYTSNLAESINSAWLGQRSLPILQGFQAIWNYIMDMVYKRREAPPTLKNPRYTNWAWKAYSKELDEARYYYVQRSEGPPSYVAGVWKSTGGKVYTVQLQKRVCSCLEFQDLEIPCRHALAVCREFGLDGEAYIHTYYTAVSYRETYKPSNDIGGVFMHPLSVDDLEPDRDSICLPPPTDRTKGRLQQKRRERGRPEGHSTKRIYKCKTCGSLNHRSTNCTSVGANLAKNKRIQKPSRGRQAERQEPIIVNSSQSSRSGSPTERLGSQLSQSLQVTPIAQRNREIATPILEAARTQLTARLQAIAPSTQESQEDIFEDAQEEVHTHGDSEEYEDIDVVTAPSPRAESSVIAARRLLEQPPTRLRISRDPHQRGSLLCAQERIARDSKGKARKPWS